MALGAKEDNNNTSVTSIVASCEGDRAALVHTARSSGDRMTSPRHRIDKELRRRIEPGGERIWHAGSCRLSEAQQDKLKIWIGETLPRTTREVGVWIEAVCGKTYESRSGLIALLHRLDLEHRKPKAVSSKLDPDKQAAFINSYENLLNHPGDDEAVLFGDAVHPRSRAHWCTF